MKTFSIPAITAMSIGMAGTTTSAFQLPRSSTTTAGRPHVATVTSSPRAASASASASSLATSSLLVLHQSSKDDNDASGGKKKRRKRKKVTADSPSSSTSSTKDEVKRAASAKALAAQMLSQEGMMYDTDDLTTFIPQKLEDDERIAAAASKAGFSISDPTKPIGINEGGIAAEVDSIFDSREFLARKREKQLEERQSDVNPNNVNPNTGIPTKKKIKRSDIAAYTKLLEIDPLADEDASYFEDEFEGVGGVDFISALLGDVERGVGDNNISGDSEASKKRSRKKTSFLGIGSGPLQVGHFIGSLALVLMAFVEYPGFPLTNLPDPLRGALQGGTLRYIVYLVFCFVFLFSNTCHLVGMNAKVCCSMFCFLTHLFVSFIFYQSITQYIFL